MDLGGHCGLSVAIQFSTQFHMDSQLPSVFCFLFLIVKDMLYKHHGSVHQEIHKNIIWLYNTLSTHVKSKTCIMYYMTALHAITLLDFLFNQKNVFACGNLISIWPNWAMLVSILPNTLLSIHFETMLSCVTEYMARLSGQVRQHLWWFPRFSEISNKTSG